MLEDGEPSGTVTPARAQRERELRLHARRRLDEEDSVRGKCGREVVATFPVRPGDDVMLVTDSGRLIRLPADQVRITGRQAMGVTLLRLNEGERVTSCFPVLDNEGDNGQQGGAAGAEGVAADGMVDGSEETP